MIRFHLETSTDHGLSGWAFDDADGAERVTLRIDIVGGEEVSICADQYREHLAQAGIGDGHAAFVLTLAYGQKIDPATKLRFSSNQSDQEFDLPDSVRQTIGLRSQGLALLQANSYLHRCALVLIIKNEAKYLREWIEYHRIFGVSHFLIFDNDSTDNLSEVLAPYIGLGVVTYVNWPNNTTVASASRKSGWVEQDTAYSLAVRVLRGKSKWVGFLDVDEFVVFNDGQVTDLPTALDGVGYPIVSLFWRLFGTSGHEEPPTGPVTASYTMRGLDRKIGVPKAFVRPEYVRFVANAHKFCVEPDDRYISTLLGTPGSRWLGIDAEYGPMCVHHYHTRSKLEFMEKVRRGWPENIPSKNSKWEEHFKRHDTNEVEDKTATLISPLLNERLAKSLELSPDVPAFDSAEWLFEQTSSVIFEILECQRSESLVTVSGVLMNLRYPWEKERAVLHDGYGRIVGKLVSDQASDIVRQHNIGDGQFGFHAAVTSDTPVYLSCRYFSAALA